MKLTIVKSSLILLAVSTLFLTSCVEVTFEESVPVTEKVYVQFPDKLVGDWEGEEGDVLSISPDKFVMSEIEGQLGSEWELKIQDDMYFVNAHAEDAWYIYMLELEDDELTIWWFDADDERMLKRLNKITSIETILSEDGKISRYHLNPTPEEFDKIIRKRVFSLLGVLTKK